jgi:hypothetical protein
LNTILAPELARAYKHLVKRSHTRIQRANKKLSEATREAADLLAQFWNEPGIADAAREAHRTVSEADGYAKCCATQMFFKILSVETALRRAADNASSKNERGKAQSVTHSVA